MLENVEDILSCTAYRDDIYVLSAVERPAKSRDERQLLIGQRLEDALLMP